MVIWVVAAAALAACAALPLAARRRQFDRAHDATRRRCGHRLAVGLSIAGAFVALPTLALVLLLRACGDGGDWRFRAQVVEARDAELCLRLIDDGPGYLDGTCVPTAEIVDLPDSIRSGDCIRLNQQLHGDLVYERRTEC